MSADGRLYAPPASPARPAARSLAWLWRLGPVLDDADAAAVGFGTLAEADELRSLVEVGRLAGAVVFAPEAGPAAAGVPARRSVDGIAKFGRGSKLEGPFTVFEEGTTALASSAGAHAVRDGSLLMLAADPETAWTLFRGFWCLPALMEFLPEVLGRPLVILPRVGCIRWDDVPGTAQHQAQGHAKSDRRQRMRVALARRVYASAGAVLNVAVAARALQGDDQVSLDGVWPRSVATIAAAVREGSFEPVCHGYLHLDPDEWAEGRIEYREFAKLDEAEARRRLDYAIGWQTETLGRAPETFVAPAWSYSEGALSAAEACGLPAWRRPELLPMLDGQIVHESVSSGLRGLRGLNFVPFETLARCGYPPTAVFHGALFDLRMGQLKASKDALTAARLLLWRDLLRVPRIPNVRWIGAGDLVRLYEHHGGIQVRGSTVDLNGARRALLVEPGGNRRVLTAS
jgi:hypothetical protein